MDDDKNKGRLIGDATGPAFRLDDDPRTAGSVLGYASLALVLRAAHFETDGIKLRNLLAPTFESYRKRRGLRPKVKGGRGESAFTFGDAVRAAAIVSLGAAVSPAVREAVWHLIADAHFAEMLAHPEARGFFLLLEFRRNGIQQPPVTRDTTVPDGFLGLAIDVSEIVARLLAKWNLR